jgi:hypothetical protein
LLPSLTIPFKHVDYFVSKSDTKHWTEGRACLFYKLRDKTGNVTHEAYSVFLELHHIRQSQRKRLGEAYDSLQARYEEDFWAERIQLTNSAIAIKKSVVMTQEVGF